MDTRTVDGPLKIRCREIRLADLTAITDLLAIGFPRHSRRFWMTALELLSRHVPPKGYPRYGLMLEAGAVPVGVLLLIFSQPVNSSTVRCCGSSWYVAPAFRSYAPLLILRSFTYRAVHLNLSPAARTLPIIEALGYKQFCSGVFVGLPAIVAKTSKVKIRRVHDAAHPEKFVPAAELQLLREHERFGCLSLWCEAADGGYPFIFRRRFVKRLVPAAQLIYCTAIDDLVRFAGPIGRFLALRAIPLIIVSANGPIPELFGKYSNAKPMYYRGSEEPRLGDLAYTEVALHGF